MVEENEIFKEKLIAYEKALTEVFRELTLKPAQCDLIRAFLIVSEGKVEFEASFFDLAKVNHKTNGDDYIKLRNNTRNALKVLKKWQEDNKLTLVEVVEVGSQNKRDKGKFIFKKSKYRFVLLAELAKEIQANPENLESIVRQTITKLKEQFTPIEKAKEYHPNYWIRIKKNTIFTLLKNIFNLAIKAEIDSPYDYCLEFLMRCREKLDGLQNDYSYQQNSDEFIKAFEAKLKKPSMQNQEENSSEG